MLGVICNLYECLIGCNSLNESFYQEDGLKMLPLRLTEYHRCDYHHPNSRNVNPHLFLMRLSSCFLNQTNLGMIISVSSLSSPASLSTQVSLMESGLHSLVSTIDRGVFYLNWDSLVIDEYLEHCDRVSRHCIWIEWFVAPTPAYTCRQMGWVACPCLGASMHRQPLSDWSEQTIDTHTHTSMMWFNSK